MQQVSTERSFGAVVCCQGGGTSLETQTLPPPAAGEMLLSLRVVGLCGTDLFKLATDSAGDGAVLGHELVGNVEATGHGVDAFQPGDRIVVPHHVACGSCSFCRSGSETMCATFKENLLAPGGFADLIMVRSRAVEYAVFRVPDDIADEQAVFVEPAACVLRGIHRAGLENEGSAAVLGCGSMGLLHLLVLKAVFSDLSVTMVDPDPERREIADKLGATASAAPGDEASRSVEVVTDGLGVDAVFDTVGGEKTLNAGLELTRAGGSVILFAHAPDQSLGQIDLNTLFKNERRVIGTYSGGLSEQRQVFDLIVSGALDASPLVTHRMPLDEFERGVELARARKALKVLYTPSSISEDG